MAVWAVVYFVKQGKNPISRDEKGFLLAVLAFWFVLVLVDGFRATDIAAWGDEVIRKLTLVVVPLYVLTLPRNSCRYTSAWLFFVSVISLVAVVSGVNYALNFEEINALLLQSKHVPIFGNIHHIYFGIYQALAIWACVFFMKSERYKLLWRVNLIVLFIMIHILASRTGLLAFYGSVGIYLISRAINSGNAKPLLIGLVLLICVPLIGYQVSTSFRNKVLNSMEDLDAVTSGDDINYKSLAMRVEAWRVGTSVFKQKFLFGVGATEIEEVMQEAYKSEKTVLFPENRIGPHNQFLEMSMAHGIVLAAALLLAFCLAYRSHVDVPYFLGMLTVFFLSFLLESYLERQQGMIAFSLFLFGFYGLSSANGKETPN